MKQGIHPEYRPVAFRDASTGKLFVTRSTATSDRTIEVDGATYPLIVVDVTSDSHPLWTGNQRIVDTAGRVQKFQEKYARFGGRAAGR
ncbi:Large ribosomal subunit protein bL31B OS=Tsukamurella paurometabola (strain ATCC 8368 / DSM/ CCUG 35730 / CIP 100753 / JCM 10117 / KCTC 9821 / NBRC 16120/ NCIMB 702349 / NCTC 13040) OX=521096 GN=rpmE2 PE=3 SV=1 [Tsukamurella paurometabola]|uniref:Large ribosomal subunit protein bL31B n=1 Tax=Tsukamurella paurometabola (strain ATCC 8368 / DSM 20162 / CCUG 35730 / CIP 100753 / JCM 10117 / KCTC 9821 / NBRC 16120 / NCIMB 702349 / NCTC 13040) TaxID=521096 RepID=D5UVU2_TSUPD|nr:type B 50S ribosomal protein L31 [Tsukamurella paurometabola]ADG79874.1 ribosomal protein L31 [Tsukamurella paurometabola DSM 20162]SUP37493.1 50S ribosomal protein L31 type B [Tsukamurella paurometabola]